MSETIPLLVCLTPHLTSTGLNQMNHIIFAILGISGRVTTLGLSRWSTATHIVDYYNLRFQIEFNFRDAKQ
jgi:hypothetical protein